MSGIDPVIADAAAQTLPVFRAGTSDAEIEAAAARAERKRKLTVRAWQVLLLVVLLGGWELGARAKIIDPFFFSTPSAIGARLWEWTTQGVDGVRCGTTCG